MRGACAGSTLCLCRRNAERDRVEIPGLWGWLHYGARFCWRSSVLGATRLDIAFDGANVWVSNLLAGTVTQARARDGLGLGTLPGRGRPERNPLRPAPMCGWPTTPATPSTSSEVLPRARDAFGPIPPSRREHLLLGGWQF